MLVHYKWGKLNSYICQNTLSTFDSNLEYVFLKESEKEQKVIFRYKNQNIILAYDLNDNVENYPILKLQDNSKSFSFSLQGLMAT